VRRWPTVSGGPSTIGNPAQLPPADSGSAEPAGVSPGMNVCRPRLVAADIVRQGWASVKRVDCALRLIRYAWPYRRDCKTFWPCAARRSPQSTCCPLAGPWRGLEGPVQVLSGDAFAVLIAGLPVDGGGVWRAKTRVEHLTWAPILSGRAYSRPLSAHGPGVRLASAARAQRHFQRRWRS
jgi:hypothetical protein